MYNFKGLYHSLAFDQDPFITYFKEYKTGASQPYNPLKFYIKEHHTKAC